MKPKKKSAPKKAESAKRASAKVAPAKPKIGRPRLELNPQQRRQLQQFAGLLTQDQLADLFNLSDRTLRRRMKDDEALLTSYKSGKAKQLALVAGRLLKMTEKNVAAAIFYLKTQGGWSERSRLDVATFDPNALTDQQLERIIAGEDLEKVLASVERRRRA